LSDIYIVVANIAASIMYFPTPPLHIIDHPADGNHHGGKRSRPLWAIILHSTVGDDSTDWLSTSSPLSNPVSVHRLIKRDGHILKIVSDDVIAFHAGFVKCGPYFPGSAAGNGNDTLGIELENSNGMKGRAYQSYPEAQLLACARQVVEWWGAYGWLPLLYHRQVDTRKSDPVGFPEDTFQRILTNVVRSAL
jgi:N-acetyl-anhydromuramyl-L-alanine amidase AmpD